MRKYRCNVTNPNVLVDSMSNWCVAALVHVTSKQNEFIKGNIVIKKDVNDVFTSLKKN